MNSPYLTKRQLDVYDFLVEFCRRERRWPMYTEVMDHFGWSSKNSLFRTYSKLIEKGYLKKDDKGYDFTKKVPGKTDVPAHVLEHDTKETEEG